MLPADTPKLAKWPFLLGDAALLGLAWLIGNQSRNPFAGTPLIAIVVCVACGAIVAAIPFLTDYARKQDEALDERQRSLESLSRTVAASAEQIGIAAGGLHEIAELAQRNLKAAEQLPAKLQEKIAALQRPPDPSRDGEREELKKELSRLRATETERLHAAVEKIAKAAAELSRLAAARPEPVENIRPERGGEAVQTASLTEATPTLSASVSTSTTETPAPVRRVRKPKVEEAGLDQPALPVSPPVADPPSVPVAPIPEIVTVTPDSNPPLETAPVDSPAPAPVIAEVPLPVPSPERKRAPRKPKPEAPAAELSEAGNVALDEPKLELADSSVQREPVEDPVPAADVVERVVSSDGATRLLVTAYIGIGNRLFIRGSGPGLSWDKGLPLQFVSIGKWRWETNDATGPVQFKLYKNDESECAALGTKTLDPGQQEEVTAAF